MKAVWMEIGDCHVLTIKYGLIGRTVAKVERFFDRWCLIDYDNRGGCSEVWETFESLADAQKEANKRARERYGKFVVFAFANLSGGDLDGSRKASAES